MEGNRSLFDMLLEEGEENLSTQDGAIEQEAVKPPVDDNQEPRTLKTGAPQTSLSADDLIASMEASSSQSGDEEDQRVQFKKEVKERCLDADQSDPLPEADFESWKVRIGENIKALESEWQSAGKNFFLSNRDRTLIIDLILTEITGLGPLEPLLAKEEISEIMVCRRDLVYIEEAGRLKEVRVRFESDKELEHYIRKIVSRVGRSIDNQNPMVDARLEDGSRVNATIPPISLDGPTLTIRKFSKTPISPDGLVDKYHTLSKRMLDFIEACVKGKMNILISGGTGTGKTTTLNVLSSFIPETERIVTIEDAAELQLPQKHKIRMEARPANSEGRGQVAIRQLVVNSLRMRPDRLVVGECRAGEAFDMLQAMNTGHAGSMTTIHANTPRDAISRLQTLVLMAGMDLPARAIKEQIVSAIDVVIQLERMRDGSRKIVAIEEIIKHLEGDQVITQTIFRFDREGIDPNGRVKGRFKGTGVKPTFIERLADNGIEVPLDMFTEGYDVNE